MKKYKTLKKQVAKTIYVEEEEKIALWYYKFLLWLFGWEEKRILELIEQQKDMGWKEAFYRAGEKAHRHKEEVMEKELFNLGYEVKCNFPMARMNPETTECIDPTKSWEVVKIAKN